MTWVGADWVISVNVTVLFVLLLGCVIGVLGGFLSAFTWLLERLGWPLHEGD